MDTTFRERVACVEALWYLLPFRNAVLAKSWESLGASRSLVELVNAFSGPALRRNRLKHLFSSMGLDSPCSCVPCPGSLACFFIRLLSVLPGEWADRCKLTFLRRTPRVRCASTQEWEVDQVQDDYAVTVPWQCAAVHEAFDDILLACGKKHEKFLRCKKREEPVPEDFFSAHGCLHARQVEVAAATDLIIVKVEKQVACEVSEEIVVSGKEYRCSCRITCTRSKASAWVKLDGEWASCCGGRPANVGCRSARGEFDMMVYARTRKQLFERPETPSLCHCALLARRGERDRLLAYCHARNPLDLFELKVRRLLTLAPTEYCCSLVETYSSEASCIHRKLEAKRALEALILGKCFENPVERLKDSEVMCAVSLLVDGGGLLRSPEWRMMMLEMCRRVLAAKFLPCETRETARALEGELSKKSASKTQPVHAHKNGKNEERSCELPAPSEPDESQRELLGISEITVRAFGLLNKNRIPVVDEEISSTAARMESFAHLLMLRVFPLSMRAFVAENGKLKAHDLLQHLVNNGETGAELWERLRRRVALREATGLSLGALPEPDERGATPITALFRICAACLDLGSELRIVTMDYESFWGWTEDDDENDQDCIWWNAGLNFCQVGADELTRLRGLADRSFERMSSWTRENAASQKDLKSLRRAIGRVSDLPRAYKNLVTAFIAEPYCLEIDGLRSEPLAFQLEETSSTGAATEADASPTHVPDMEAVIEALNDTARRSKPRRVQAETPAAPTRTAAAKVAQEAEGAARKLTSKEQRKARASARARKVVAEKQREEDLDFLRRTAAARGPFAGVEETGLPSIEEIERRLARKLAKEAQVFKKSEKQGRKRGASLAPGVVAQIFLKA